MKEHGQNLMDSFYSAIDNLDHPDVAAAFFHRLGYRHTRYHVTRRHYDKFVQCLKESFQWALVMIKEHNEDTKAAWSKLIDFIAEKMILGIDITKDQKYSFSKIPKPRE